MPEEIKGDQKSFEKMTIAWEARERLSAELFSN